MGFISRPAYMMTLHIEKYATSTAVVREVIIREVVTSDTAVSAQATSIIDPNMQIVSAQLGTSVSHEIVPSNMHVRRRTSSSRSAARNSSGLGSPTKDALRDQVVHRGDVVDHACARRARFTQLGVRERRLRNPSVARVA